jgi:hypothetical protein
MQHNKRGYFSAISGCTEVSCLDQLDAIVLLGETRHTYSTVSRTSISPIPSPVSPPIRSSYLLFQPPVQWSNTVQYNKSQAMTSNERDQFSNFFRIFFFRKFRLSSVSHTYVRTSFFFPEQNKTVSCRVGMKLKEKEEMVRP